MPPLSLLLKRRWLHLPRSRRRRGYLYQPARNQIRKRAEYHDGLAHNARTL
jgi:hypothetical protein